MPAPCASTFTLWVAAGARAGTLVFWVPTSLPFESKNSNDYPTYTGQ